MTWTNAQTRLGITADGVPGVQTYTALINYMTGQEINPRIALGCATYFKNMTPERVAEFLAQTCHETGGFRRFEENLNYKPAQMLKVWPRHFSPALAASAAGNPELVAEIAYGVRSKTGQGRMGNNKPGDGYRYRGRGLIQLTGKANYSAMSKITGLDLLTHPEMAVDPLYGVPIAMIFFNQNKIWDMIDAKNYLGARKAVNGGTLGLTEIANYRNKVLSLFRPL